MGLLSFIPAIGPVLDTVSSLVTNAANAGQSQKQMDFQERMRSTQYQTAVEDMKKAGLNPALAYQQGGAGTPTGQSAQLQSPVRGEGIQNALNSALTIQKQKADIAAVSAGVGNTEQDTQKKDAETNLTRLTTMGQVGLLRAQIGETLARTSNLDANTKAVLEKLASEIDLNLANIGALNAGTKLTNARTVSQQQENKVKKVEGKAADAASTAVDVIKDRGESVLEIGKDVLPHSLQDWQDKLKRGMGIPNY